MTDKAHSYALHLVWEGNRGTGTADYLRYGRNYRICVEGKPDLSGSADPQFRGDPTLPNPEEMVVMALSSCHMLSFLALIARERIEVVAYEDRATGTLELGREGGGKFTNVTLRPKVTVAHVKDIVAMPRLHERAHDLCFIANSVRFPVLLEATADMRASK